MKIKNKLLATGLVAGLAIFGTVSAVAAQTCQEMQGDLHEISVRSSNRRYVFPGEDKIISELKHENLMRLDERAKMICSGRAFCIDESSIKNEVDVAESFVSLFYVISSAVVNCLK